MRFFDSLKQWLKLRQSRKRALIGANSVLYGLSSIENPRGQKNLIRVGEFTHIRGELFVFAHGGEISIGDYCYVGADTRIWSGAGIRIGHRVLIAHCVSILDNISHPIDPHERHEHFRKIITTGHPTDIGLHDRPIVIEDDAWIGCMSIILPGVTIGEGAIVGAGSVVTKDVAPFTVVAGNPARVIRELARGEM